MGAPVHRMMPCTCQAGPVRMEGAYYEDIVDRLAQQALKSASSLPAGKKKHLVGIAGAPGSGKSTLSHAVVRRINELAGSEAAALLPMDGFHFYKRELDKMPDPKEAYARRGAHWTFDADAFVACVRKVAATGEASVPSFDHGVGDPVPDDIHIKLSHKVVVVEGNYVLLDIEPWHQLRSLFDDTWFVDVPLDAAMDRVFKRQTSIGLAPEVSRGRIAGNDRPNGELINESKKHAKVIVPSSIPFRSPAAAKA